MTPWQQSEQRRINTVRRREIAETRSHLPRTRRRGWLWAVPVMTLGFAFWACWPRIAVMLAQGWSSS